MVDTSYRDEAWLREQYLINDKSSREIARLCDVSSHTICTYINRFKLKKNFDRVFKHANWLNEQYVNKRRSAVDIAAEQSVSLDAILYWIHKYHIPTIPAYERLKGIPLSEEHKKRLSDAKKGKPSPHRGFHHAEESKKHMSEGSKHLKPWLGKHLSEEHKQKISKTLTGRPGWTPTEEQRKKMSDRTKGRVMRPPGYRHSPETIQKIRETHIGVHPSEETKQKLAEYRGERASNWRGGLSFGAYCKNFNDKLKEEVREAFGRKCFLCGISENGYKLHVHHCDYNKGQGCGQRWCLIPLCRSCHGKTTIHRHYYFNLLANYWAIDPNINFAFGDHAGRPKYSWAILGGT